MGDWRMPTLDLERRRRAARRGLAGLVALVAVVATIVTAALWVEIDAREGLDEAFTTPIAAAEVDAELSLRVQRTARPEWRLLARGAGPTRSSHPGRPPALDWRVTVAAPGARREGRLMSAGERAQLRLPEARFELDRRSPPGRLLGPPAAGVPLGLVSRSWFQGVERGGEGAVDGAATERFVADLRVDRLLEDADRALRGLTAPLPITPALPGARERRNLALALRDSRAIIDVAQEDGTLRRLEAEGRLRIPAARRARPGAVSGGGFSLRLVLRAVRPDPAE
jgi:hypothetical protein